jgi:hypothetical protein
LLNFAAFFGDGDLRSLGCVGLESLEKSLRQYLRGRKVHHPTGLGSNAFEVFDAPLLAGK